MGAERRELSGQSGGLLSPRPPVGKLPGAPRAAADLGLARVESTLGNDDEGGRMASQKLQGKKIAFIATDMVEEVELTKPWEAVKEAGGQPELISMETGEIQAFNHYDKSNTYKVDKDFSSARVGDYDALVVPGGVGNPDTLRTDDDAVEFVR